ncbi:hypothetical protein BDW22DRAFT_1355871 [Trametopsis cervina]|nr:hypothetical protein BDW22DRAFT_1355871 [Trametopsis cervina]
MPFSLVLLLIHLALPVPLPLFRHLYSAIYGHLPTRCLPLCPDLTLDVFLGNNVSIN